MSIRPSVLARFCLVVAGAFFLFETGFGCIAVLGVGFSSALAVVLDLCLTLPFPVFLIGLRSITGSAIGLWILFAARWAVTCMVSVPPRIVNPLGSPHNLVFLGCTILVSFSGWLVSRYR